MAPDRTNPENPTLLSLAFSDGVPKHALIAGAVVGTILNLINQGDVLWAGAEVDAVKLGLTYLVPYCVATYGAISARRRFVRAGQGRARSPGPEGGEGSS